jgi:adenylate cyclase
MLSIHISNSLQDHQFVHSAGRLELGRGPQRDVPRLVIKDGFVSRDHAVLAEMPYNRLWIMNLSHSQEIALPDGTLMASRTAQEAELPLRLRIGHTVIDVESAQLGPIEDEAEPRLSAADTDYDASVYVTVQRPARSAPPPLKHRALKSLGGAPTPERFAYWLESVIGLQRAPGGSRAYYDQTSRALTELVDLDMGAVLLRTQGRWQVVGRHGVDSRVPFRPSRTLLDLVVRERRTFYQEIDEVKLLSKSLVHVDAVVVSPILSLQNGVAGVMYGSRTWDPQKPQPIMALEAQIVQLLAAGVSDNLVRTAATRTRTQFEQFFSPQLAEELERNPNLLTARSQDVTILSSDLRGFTHLCERVGAEVTFRLVREVMDRMSDHILAHGGVIVDYAGDGILAMWNAPVQQQDHAVRACRAALDMLHELPLINEHWQAKLGQRLDMGIGINTGLAQVGNTGSSRKLKYGPHGMTVNLASRIQDATKKAGVPLLISEAVRRQLPRRFLSRRVGSYELRGVSERTPLYQLAEEREEAAQRQIDALSLCC